MTKRLLEPESGGTMELAAECNIVFVDTSLGTHIVMLASASDTVLDFKKKIVQEHAKCFPKNGEICIHSLKVKRKGNFYHLPDFMLVCSALHGVKGNWFLTADASCSLNCYINQKSSGCGKEDHCVGFSSDANEILTMTLPGGVIEENIVAEITAAQDVEKYSDKITNFQRNNSVVNSLEDKYPDKMKRTMRYDEDVWLSPTLADNNLNRGALENKRISKKRRTQPPNDQATKTKHSSDGGKENSSFVSDASEFTENVALSKPSGIPESVVSLGSLRGKDINEAGTGCLHQKEPKEVELTSETHDGRKKKKKKEKIKKPPSIDLDKSGIVHTGQDIYLLDNHEKHREPSLDLDPESILCENNQISAGNDLSFLPIIEKEKQDETLETNQTEKTCDNASSKNKKVKKKSKRQPVGSDVPENMLIKDLEVGVKVYATTEIANTGQESRNVDSSLVLSYRSEEKCEEISAGDGLSLLPPIVKESQDETLAPNQTEKTCENAHEKNKKVKKKSKRQPIASDIPENSLIADQEVGAEVHATNEAANTERDSRNVDSSLVLSQRSQGKHEEFSAGDDLSFLPAIEKEREDETLATNQTEKTCENVRNKNKKVKKKSKRQPIASDVPENLLITDQDVGVEVYATNEVANIEKESRNVDSSLVLSLRSQEKREDISAGDGLSFLPIIEKESRDETLETNQTEKTCENACNKNKKVRKKSKRQPIASLALSHISEEKLEEIHGAADTDDLVGTIENKDEEIDFRRHFVAGEKKDTVASVDKVKEAMKSTIEIKAGKKAKMYGLTSESTSTGSQNSLASFVNKDDKNKSHARMENGRKDGDSTVYSDCNDSIPISTIKSIGVVGGGEKDSSPSSFQERSTLPKHDENPVSTPLMKKKNTVLKKLVSEISGTYSGSRGNARRLLSLNASDEIVMKTPQKNSLLTKRGSIFQDKSGESSGDENGNAISDDSTCSPSESSSQAGCSAGESDSTMPEQEMDPFMQKEHLTDGKDISKLNSVPASNELTMSMILRSSKRYKIAKMTASQNDLDQTDSQPIEFDPESQTN